MLRKDVMRSAMAGVVAVCVSIVCACLGNEAHADEPTATVVLEWTAPGDDGYQGRATRYDMRYSLTPITGSNFDRATPVPGLPVPGSPRTRDRVEVGGLTPETAYYFAIKTVDETGNWSGMSNVVQVVAHPPGTDPGTDQAPKALDFMPPYPNPARATAWFEAILPRDEHINVEVFDAIGRRVQTLAYGGYPAGRNVFSWDLRSGDGERVRNGMYWARLQTGGRVLTRPFIVAH